MLATDRQHSAGPRRGIVQRPHHARFGQRRVVFDEDQIDHQPDGFARREMLSGGLVGKFGELADQFLEHGPHLGIADDLGVKVDVGELLGHQIKQLGLGQPVDLGVKIEALENVSHGGRKRLHVGEEVFLDMVLVAHQLLHVQGRRIEEELPRLAQQERLRVQPGLLSGGQLGQHGGLGLLQHAIEPP